MTFPEFAQLAYGECVPATQGLKVEDDAQESEAMESEQDSEAMELEPKPDLAFSADQAFERVPMSGELRLRLLAILRLNNHDHHDDDALLGQTPDERVMRALSSQGHTQARHTHILSLSCAHTHTHTRFVVLLFFHEGWGTLYFEYLGLFDPSTTFRTKSKSKHTRTHFTL